MDLDDILHHYFGRADPDDLDPAARADGVERMTIDLGRERDAGRRFALWTVLHALGDAPDIDRVFKDERERRAAHDYARAMSRLGRE